MPLYDKNHPVRGNLEGLHEIEKYELLRGRINEKGIIKSLTEDFEFYANKTENGIKFWFVRDLQYIPGYTG